MWIDDDRDDLMAEKLGLSQEGYPNIAVYHAKNGYIGRVIGFGGTEKWFGDLEEVVGVGDRLTEAMAKAEEASAEWVAVAGILESIPSRAKDAMDALQKVPKRKQRSKEYKAALALVEARAAWEEVDTSLDELMKGVRGREAAQEKAPDAVEQLETYLEAHLGNNPATDPMALARQGFFFVILDRTDDAVGCAKKLLESYPESPQAKALLRGLR